MVVDPRHAGEQLRAARPVWKSAFITLLATGLYCAVLHGALRDAFDVLRLGGYDRGALAIFVDHLIFLLPATLVVLLALAFGFVPLALSDAANGQKPPQFAEVSSPTIFRT